MSIAAKFNRSNPFTYEVPENLPYTSLKDLYAFGGKDKSYKVHALFINTKGKFDDAPVAVLDDCIANFPAHTLDVVKEICADEEAVSAINAGKFGFTIKEYSTKNSKDPCYSPTWIDLE